MKTSNVTLFTAIFIAMALTFSCSSGAGGGGGSTTYCVIDDSNECNALKLSAKQCSEKDGYLDIECPAGYDIIGGNQNNQNNAPSSSQAYYCTFTKKTTLADCMNNLQKWNGNGIIKIRDCNVAVGRVVNGIVEMSLPNTIPDGCLTSAVGCQSTSLDIQSCSILTCEDDHGPGSTSVCTDNVVVSPKDVRKASNFYLYDSDGDEIARGSGLMGAKGSNTFENVDYEYYSKSVSITGTRTDTYYGEKSTYNINAKAGWNEMYSRYEKSGTTEVSTESTNKSILTMDPKTFKWVFMMY